MGHPTVAPAAEHLWQVRLEVTLHSCLPLCDPAGAGCIPLAQAWVRYLMIRWTIKLCAHPLAGHCRSRAASARLGDAEGAVAAFEHARGIGALSPADATTVNYLLNALSRDSEKAFER